MKERPILFSGPMVRAILDGRKTQTRRVVKGFTPPECRGRHECRIEGGFGKWYLDGQLATHSGEWLQMRYGQPGDRLWVRETWCVWKEFDNLAPSKLWPGDEVSQLAVDYAANPARVWCNADAGKWRPSIHMPRWASRITLEVTGVRVERLQDISDSDAKAEGVEDSDTSTARMSFARLWSDINGAESWENNPWVWVIKFRRLQPSTINSQP